MTDQTTKVLGAARLYRAVREDNVGLAAMYVMSAAQASGVVQNFDTQRLLDEWEKTLSVEMLRALIVHPELNKWSYRSRRGPVDFGYGVLQLIGRKLVSMKNKLKNDNAQGVKELQKVNAVILEIITSNHTTDFSSFVNPLTSAMRGNEEWAYATAALNKRLALHVVGAFSQNWGEDTPAYLAIHREVLDWYLDLFGTISVAEGGPGIRVARRLFENELYADLVRVQPDETLRKAWLQRANLDKQITRITEEHEHYHRMLVAAPWAAR